MFNSKEIWLSLKKYALMAVYNWVVCNGNVAAQPLFGLLSWRPVTGSGLCGLIDGRVPFDASSGCPVIGRAVETGR